MASIIDNLNTLLEQKKAIKASLESKGKEPTDKLSTYAGLIDELDNEEQVSYVLANSDGSKKIYAQLSSKEPVTLTATANDIRQNTSAITNKGFTEGTKNIPAYQSERGVSIIPTNTSITLQNDDKYDYTKFQATLAIYNSSISKSVQVDKVTVDDALYTANSTEKLSDLSIDHDNKKIDFGITNGSTKAVMRYFIMREEV